MARENDALLRRWFEEVWNKGRADAIDEMLAEDCVVHGLSDTSGQPISGVSGFRVFHKAFRDAFPDIEVIVEDTVCEGDKVAGRCLVRGTHTGDGLGIPATAAGVEFTGIGIGRVLNGKFIEVWNNFDFQTMQRQLKVV
jgi:steroid delta-isomerase-like uncharacterized protein